jgi:hypothetical protein
MKHEFGLIRQGFVIYKRWPGTFLKWLKKAENIWSWYAIFLTKYFLYKPCWCSPLDSHHYLHRQWQTSNTINLPTYLHKIWLTSLTDISRCLQEIIYRFQLTAVFFWNLGKPIIFQRNSWQLQQYQTALYLWFKYAKTSLRGSYRKKFKHEIWHLNNSADISAESIKTNFVMQVKSHKYTIYNSVKR